MVLGVGGMKCGTVGDGIILVTDEGAVVTDEGAVVLGIMGQNCSSTGWDVYSLKIVAVHNVAHMQLLIHPGLVVAVVHGIVLRIHATAV